MSVVSISRQPQEGRVSMTLMTMEDVAKFLVKSYSWVAHKTAEGKLPSIKVGGERRIIKEELEKWLLEQR